LIANASAEISAAADIHPLDSEILMSKVKLTRKQYYFRLSNLISSGLVKRSSGSYKLTSLGRIAYEVSLLVEQAIKDYWKLRAIDALKSKSGSDILGNELEKIIDMLISDNKLKKILLYAGSSNNDSTDKQFYRPEAIKTPVKIPRRKAPLLTS
jgi:hypothetical protein